MKLGIGIIGCGGISASHIDIYSRFPEETQIVALCDIIPDRAESRKQLVKDKYTQCVKKYENTDRTLAAIYQEYANYDVRTYTDASKLAEDRNVDAVNICTPPYAHHSTMLAAANGGKHVFCEGPIAGDLKQADEMTAAARENDVKFTVQYGTRFTRTARMAKKAVDEGRLGRILMGNVDVMWYRDQSYYDSDPWRGKWNGERGGATFHHGRYAIDLYLWLMGQVSSIYAQMDTFTHDIEVEDCSAATLRFKSGAIGQIAASTSAHPGIMPTQRIEIFGDKASISVIPAWKIGSSDQNYAERLMEELENEVSEMPYEGMIGQIRDFIEAILEDRDPCVLPESVCHQVEVTKGVYKSVATGMPINLPLLPYDPFYSA